MNAKSNIKLTRAQMIAVSRSEVNDATLKWHQAVEALETLQRERQELCATVDTKIPAALEDELNARRELELALNRLVPA